MPDCAVLIPTHTTDFSNNEKMSIERGKEVFLPKSDVDMFFVLPEREKGKVVDEDIQQVYMPDEYFKSQPAYCKMMRHPEIYKNFPDYEYVLIYQTDAFIIKDDLEKWMDIGYDYVGAPWVNIYNETNPEMDYYDFVGNGGFSMRNTKKFIEITEEVKNVGMDGLPKAEDRFFNWHVIHEIPFTKPQIFQALQFAFETVPQTAYKLNGNSLPFGCHAWQKAGRKEFYDPIFRKLGYHLQ